MIEGERPFCDCERALIERLGVGIAALDENIWMIGTECFFINRQRALVERLGFSIATLSAVHTRQVVQRSCDSGMIGTERFFVDRQRALRQLLGIGVATLIIELVSLLI